MVALLGLTLNSCKKEFVKPDVKQTTSSADANSTLLQVDEIFNLTMDIAGGLAQSGMFKTNAIASCADITIDSSSSPYHATINFGSGCLADNGKYYSGVLQMDYTDLKDLRNPGSVLHISFTDFVLDNTELDGSFNLDNNGLNMSGNLVFDISMNVSIHNQVDNETSTLNGNVAYEFIAGQGTESDEDDFLALTGQITGTTPSSSSIDLTILSPVISSRAVGCDEFYIQGEVKLEESGQSDKFIDYGNGDCDDQAVQTVDGISTPITLDGGFQ